jgi:hypothetical protein
MKKVESIIRDVVVISDLDMLRDNDPSVCTTDQSQYNDHLTFQSFMWSSLTSKFLYYSIMPRNNDH